MAGAHLGMLLRAGILGLSFTVVALMTEGLPPLLLTALRFCLAALALLPFAWRALDMPISPGGWLLYSLLGLCQATFFGGMFWAAHRITALEMAVLYVSVPFLAYCLGLAFKVEKSSGSLLAILALGAGGALALAWAEGGRRLGGLSLGVTEAVYFAGCIGLALYAVISRWGLSRGWLADQAAVRAFWSLVIGAVFVGAVGLAMESPRDLASVTSWDLLMLGYLGVVSTGGTFWLMQQAAAVLTPATANAYSYVPPLVSALLLLVTDPQSVSWRWLPGAVLVVVAMALLMRRDAEGEREIRPHKMTAGPADNAR